MNRFERIYRNRPGGRASAPADLVDLTTELTARMVLGGGLAPDVTAARTAVEAAWDDGRAWERLERWLTAQGGRLAPEREDLGLETAPLALEVEAARDGWLLNTDCRTVLRWLDAGIIKSHQDRDGKMLFW